MRLLAVSLLLPVLLSGCSLQNTATSSSSSGLALQGRVHGGQQPINGGHVYLFAANSTGYGGSGIAPSNLNTSISLLTSVPGVTNVDTSGGATNGDYYVKTAADGSFSITGDYTCPGNAQVYLYALGGDPGAGTNPAAGLLAALGACPASGNFAATTPYVWINEVTTVATAYAMAGFATDATHVSSSGTSLAQVGIANAFANAANLATLSTGVARSLQTGGTIAFPTSLVNTLANILASCVNSTNPTSVPCNQLFSNARSGGLSGTIATDTATAAINIAHNPGNAVTALFGISTPALAFAPARTVQPPDFTLGLEITGGGVQFPQSIAVDASGNVWAASLVGTVSKFSSTGIALSPAAGFVGDGTVIQDPYGIAIDSQGNAWIANYGSSGAPNVTKLAPDGTVLSGNGFRTSEMTAPRAIAVDGFDNVWVANHGPYSLPPNLPMSNGQSVLLELSNSGSFLSPPGGYAAGGASLPSAIGIDSSENVWLAGQNAVYKFSNSGAPISGSTGYTGAGVAGPTGLAIDASGNAWISNSSYFSVSEVSNSGNPTSPSSGYPTGSNVSLEYPEGVAIDGAGNAWIPLNAAQGVLELGPTGSVISPVGGYQGGFQNRPIAVAIDGSGNVWTAASAWGAVSELIGAAVPVVTPLSTGVKNGGIGARP